MNSTKKIIKIAILDLNEGLPNQGMRCIHKIVNDWKLENNTNLQCDVFDVRCKEEIPDLSYDIYISSGGPGSPIGTKNLDWDKKYMQWIRDIEQWNTDFVNYPKKKIFFICHSFQLACRYFEVAEVCERKSTSFGIFPVHMTDDGANEPVFSGMKDPFYAVDSRDYQVIKPNQERMDELGAKILAIEKERPHVEFERAIMAMRFNANFIGTQFHPEADATGMTIHLYSEEKKNTVIKFHGADKWKNMIDQLNNPDKIIWTHDHILPNFLNMVVEELVEQ